MKLSIEERQRLLAIFPVGYVADGCEPAKGHGEKKPREQVVAEV